MLRRNARFKHVVCPICPTPGLIAYRFEWNECSRATYSSTPELDEPVSQQKSPHHIHVCKYMHTDVDRYALHLYADAPIHQYTSYTNIRTCTNIQVHMHTPAHTHTHMCTHQHMHVHTVVHIHIHMNRCTNIYKYVHRQSWRGDLNRTIERLG